MVGLPWGTSQFSCGSMWFVVHPSSLPHKSPTSVVRSPLSLRASLSLLASLVVVTVITFGAVAAVILVVPGARGIGLSLLAASLPICFALMLVV